MSVNDLINSLSESVEPRKPLGTLRKRWLEILSSSTVAVLLTFLLFSIRYNLSDALHTVFFWVGLGLLAVCWLGITYSMAILELPQVSNSKSLRVSLLSLVALSAYYLFLGLESHQWSDGVSVSGIHCSIGIMALSLLPSVAMVLLVRRGATTRPIFLGINLGLGSSVLGALALQFSCPSDVSIHLFLWHLVVPIAICAVAGALVGKKFLSW